VGFAHQHNFLAFKLTLQGLRGATVKKILLGLAIGASVLSLAMARPLSSLEQSRTIVFGNSRDYPPFYSIENGRLIGFEIDFGEALAGKLGFKAEWRNVGFDSLFLKLGENKIDVALASHTITPAREKVVDFVIPHYCTGTILVALRGQPTAENQMQGKVIGATTSSSFAEYARKIPGVKQVQTFKTEEESFRAMQTKKVDAVITDRLTAQTLAKKFPNPAVNFSFLLVEDRIAMAVKKGNIQLLQKLNQTVEEMKKDGTINRLAFKYFGSNVTCE
jgi:polar amino acid transport system substrate-binding protein